MKSSITPVRTWLRLAPLFLVTLILAGCFSGAQTVFGTPTPASAQAFSSRLIASIAARNYRALERMMGDPFLFALWQSEGSEMAPADAIANIREVLIDPAVAISFTTGDDLGGWLGGADPLGIWSPDVKVVDAVGLTGLGETGADEALLIVAQNEEGEFFWYAILVAYGGFGERVTVTPTPTPAPSGDLQSLPTDVRQVVILSPVDIREGPARSYPKGDTALRGETLTVLGISADGQWWNIACPRSGSVCWITSNPTFVRTIFSPTRTAVPATATATRAPATSTPRPAGPLRIVFDGAGNGFAEGPLFANQPQQVIFFGQAGLIATIRITSPSPAAAFSVQGNNDGVVYRNASSGGTEFVFQLPRSQDYLVSIIAPVRTSFTIRVSLRQGAPPQPPTSTPTRTPTRTPQPAGPERISFAQGQISALVSGPLYAGAPKQYVFRALAGQQALILWSSLSGGANVSVVGAGDGVAYWLPASMPREFSINLPRSQDYLITLSAPVNTSYTLELTIPPGSGPTPTPIPPTPTPVTTPLPLPPERIGFAPGTDTAVISSPLFVGEARQYLFGAAAGQQARILFESSSGSTAVSVVGVSDGVIYWGLATMPREFWIGLPRSQDYLLTIVSAVNTSFVLELFIPPPGGPTPAPTFTPTPTATPIVLPPTSTPSPTPVMATPTPIVATPTPTPERINFAPGATSATVNGYVVFPVQNEYLVRALAGQRMTVQISSAFDAANFAITGVSDGIPYKRLVNEDRTFVFDLPLTQDYLIAVAVAGGDANYSLFVQIETSAPPTETPLPPTETPLPPTETPIPTSTPTSTPIPVMPTVEPILPTLEPVLPTPEPIIPTLEPIIPEIPEIPTLEPIDPGLLPPIDPGELPPAP